MRLVLVPVPDQVVAWRRSIKPLRTRDRNGHEHLSGRSQPRCESAVKAGPIAFCVAQALLAIGFGLAAFLKLTTPYVELAAKTPGHAPSRRHS